MQMRTLTLHSPKFSPREIVTATDNCDFSLGNRPSFVKEQVVLRTGVTKSSGIKQANASVWWVEMGGDAWGKLGQRKADGGSWG